jgi:DNA-binding transcriptional regulator YiaG
MALVDELRNEIKRIALREIRGQGKQTRKLVASHRHHIAALRRQVEALEKDVARLQKATRRVEKATAVEVEPPRAGKTRFDAAAWRAYRERAGVSARSIAILLGVSMQTVYSYESGKTSPKPAQALILAELRKIGIRALRNRVAEAEAEAEG